jgi:hypothetical protein
MASAASMTESVISGSHKVEALESTSQPLFFMTKPEALNIIVDFFNNPVIREQYKFPPNKNFPGGSDKFFDDIIAYVTENYTKDYVFSTDKNTILEIESGGGSGMIGGEPEYKCSMLVVWLVIITLILFFGGTKAYSKYYGGSFLAEETMRTSLVWIYAQVAILLGLTYGREWSEISRRYTIFTTWLSATIVDFIYKKYQELKFPGNPKQDALNVTFFKMALTLVRFLCQLIGMVDNSEIMTEEQKTQNALVEKAIRSAKTAVVLGQPSVTGDYTFNILFKMLLTGKNDKGEPLRQEDSDRIAYAIRNLSTSVSESIEDMNMKSLVSKQLLALKETVRQESANLDTLQTQLLALPPTAATTTAVSTSNSSSTSNASSLARASSSSPARARNQITSFFPSANKDPGGAPGGIGGRRSRRRMQKSKRGNKHSGRSRMRKMRTKKRRMSRRKNRR